MIQIIEQTKDEKVKMYKKLSKKELIEMLIEANKHLNSRPLTWKNEGFYPDKVPYHTLCPCSPENGGSGICGCTMANQLVDRNNTYQTEYVTELTYNSAQKETKNS